MLGDMVIDSYWSTDYILMDRTLFLKHCSLTCENEEFKEKVLQTKFDMIFVNIYFGECFYALAYKDQASLVLLQTFPLMNYMTKYLGFYGQPSVIPLSVSGFSDKMNFWERVGNFLLDWAAIAFHELVDTPLVEAVYRKHLGNHYPGLREITQNTSLLLSHTDPVATSMRALTPDVVELGGLHCRDPRPLPKDLEDFVAGAEDGFIYFSLGISMSSYVALQTEMEQKLLRVFSKLKQRVLWKSGTTKTAVIQDNILFKNFFPQQDVLEHDKIRLYISHGGLFGTFESIYHAVPVLGVPTFFDQFANIALAVNKGYALQLDLNTVDDNELENTIKKLIEDERYKQRVTELSKIMKDQLNSPMEKAVFHIERVLNHKVIVHLQNINARTLNIFQLHSMDVIGFLVVTIVAVLTLVTAVAVFSFKKLKNLLSTTRSVHQLEKKSR